MRKFGSLLFCLTLVAVVAHWIGAESLALAQSDGSSVNKFSFPGESEYGGYLNPIKLFFVFVLFWLWVWTTDWVAQDCQDRRLSLATWVLPNVFVFGLLFWLLVSAIPMFIGYALAIAAWAVPLGMYIKTRNQLVPPHEMVMTKDHIRYVMSRLSGGKVKGEVKAGWESGPQMEIRALGGDETTNTQNLYNARKLPDAYVWVKELISEMTLRRATKVMMDFTKDGVAMRYLIDGVWLAGENRDRESSDAMLTVMKTLCNLNPEDRRSRQSGEFFVKIEKTKMNCSVTSQGTQTGERVLLAAPIVTAKLETLADLGMRDGMIEELKSLMGSSNGLFVFTAKTEGGLSTLFQVGLLSTDRLLRDFSGVEVAGAREPEILNVAMQEYGGETGKTQEGLLPSIIRNQPDALVVRRIENKAAFDLLLEQANGTRIVFSSVNVKEDAAEGILRLLSHKVDPKSYASALVGVLNTRLARRLCKSCREPFAPNPQLLKRLGIPPGKVEKLYRPPSPPGPDDPVKPPCEECGGVGYIGRVGIFELLKVNDQVRQAIVKKPTLESVRAASKAAGNRSLQEEAIRLVATGVTSLEEIQRVLKD